MVAGRSHDLAKQERCMLEAFYALAHLLITIGITRSATFQPAFHAAEGTHKPAGRAGRFDLRDAPGFPCAGALINPMKRGAARGAAGRPDLSDDLTWSSRSAAEIRRGGLARRGGLGLDHATRHIDCD